MNVEMEMMELYKPLEKWNQALSLNEKLDILRSYLNVDSLADVPFWTLYKAVKKLIKEVL